ncbi:MAG: hypothetical protein LN417_01450, partial [Candidatus Thermoplasmatota archaeon]|nr:hypothetical protein [Candidatus Thermoplasmatota archaeon]
MTHPLGQGYIHGVIMLLTPSNLVCWWIHAPIPMTTLAPVFHRPRLIAELADGAVLRENDRVPAL